jgi:hypothetical protein
VGKLRRRWEDNMKMDTREMGIHILWNIIFQSYFYFDKDARIQATVLLELSCSLNT